MISKYNSKCKKCGEWISKGKTVIKKDEITGNWVHENCTSIAIAQNKQKELVGSSYQTGINVPLPIENNPITLNGVPLRNEDMTDELYALIQSADETAPAKEFIPTHFQSAIFDFIQNGTGHAVVEAVAGSGKTTTIEQSLSLLSSDLDIAFVAFNKHIAKELKNRCLERGLDNVRASTLHSLGLDNVSKYLGKFPKIETDKVGLLLDDIYPVSRQALNDGVITKEQRRENFAKRLSMRKLVSISKSTLVDVYDGNSVMAMIERYNVDIDDEYMAEIVEKLPEIMELCKNTSIIDFDDMIWLPIVLNMPLIKFDILMVDEAQDLNVSQIEFVLGSIKETGRIIAVGDRNQSLYGFRGADTDAIPNLIEALHATTLPLSITFRCPVSHVELAKKLVPQIEARENAPEGTITQMDYIDLASMLDAGDMVICRTNGPLVRPAFECIRAGKKAVIRGKDIGSDLIAMIKRFDTDDLGMFEVSLAEYFEREYNKLLNKGKEMSAMMLEDKVNTLRMIINEVSTVAELIGKIAMLFDDNNIGIIFSSVHRAKGLEAERVFILRPDLMPHPKAKKDWEQQQEWNCVYVAQTRSKDSLFIVNGGNNI